MASLQGRAPKDSFAELLKINGTAVDGTLRSVESGSGIATPLKLSATALAIHDLTFPSTGATAGRILAVAANGTSMEWIAAPSGTATNVTSLGNVVTLGSGGSTTTSLTSSSSVASFTIGMSSTSSTSGALNIIGGANSGTNTAGAINITGGAQSNGYAGGSVTITGGSVSGTTGFGSGGDVTLRGGTSVKSNAGSVNLIAGSGDSNSRGGSIGIYAGSNASNNTVGSVTIAGGDHTLNSNSFTAGSVTVRAGNSSSASGTGGSLTLSGGSGGTNGYVRIMHGGTERLRILGNGAWSVGTDGTSTGTNGQVLTSNGSGSAPTWSNVQLANATTLGTTNNAVTLTASSNTTAFVIQQGTTSTTSNSGAFTIRGGANTSTGHAGELNIMGGNASGGNGGAVTISGGTGGTAGAVTISGGTGVSGNAGSVTVNGGDMTNTTSNTPGSLTLRGGDTTSSQSSAKGGDLVLRAGNAAGTSPNWTDGGNVTISAGRGSNAGGYISLSTAAGNSALTERLRITTTGSWNLGGAAGTAGQVLTSNGSGSAPTWQAAGASDARLKTNVETLTGALDKIKQINGVAYDWLDTEKYGEQREVGVLAQEVEAVYPEAVRENEAGDGMKGVMYNRLVAPLIEAVKELAAQNAALLARIEALESK